MQKSEHTEKGLMAIKPNDNSNVLIKFGRMKYDSKLKLYRSDSCLTLSDFVCFPRKQDAIKHAQSTGRSANHVERIGSRFWSGWGIRHDHRDNYFLAEFE